MYLIYTHVYIRVQKPIHIYSIQSPVLNTVQLRYIYIYIYSFIYITVFFMCTGQIGSPLGIHFEPINKELMLLVII